MTQTLILVLESLCELHDEHQALAMIKCLRLGRWLPEESARLKELVAKHGTSSWPVSRTQPSLTSLSLFCS